MVLIAQSVSLVLMVSIGAAMGLARMSSSSLRVSFSDVEVLSKLPSLDLSSLGATQKGKDSLLTMPFNELTEYLGGSGRAKLFWDLLKRGEDPLNPDIEGAVSQRVRNALATYCVHFSGGSDELLTTEVHQETLSECGTRKFLQRCKRDGGEIESVLIPSNKFDRTTLCVSTQIGCDRACKFCLTGTMGFIRNLSADEIVSQVILGRRLVKESGMPDLSNVVFMGMGDAGRNLDEVEKAAGTLVDRQRMGMAASKVTISTVGPSPEIFMRLASMPGTMAWSLHSPNDAVRKALVPSTRHTTVELRDGLVAALATRKSLRTRTIMIACTLIAGINDSPDDARALAEFVKPVFETAPKVALDLIPYNDISVPGLDFRPPEDRKVKEFTDVLRSEGIYCSVRVPRGRKDSAACGQLATKTKRERAKRLSK